MDWTRHAVAATRQIRFTPARREGQFVDYPATITSSLHCHRGDRIHEIIRFVLLPSAVAGALAAAADNSRPASDALDQTIDKITAREAENVKAFARYSPIVETYVQGFRKDKELAGCQSKINTFLGRASFKSRLLDDSFIVQDRPVVTHRLLREIKEAIFERRKGWVPLGFTQMAVIDMQPLRPRALQVCLPPERVPGHREMSGV